MINLKKKPFVINLKFAYLSTREMKMVLLNLRIILNVLAL